MDDDKRSLTGRLGTFMARHGVGMRTKLITIFVLITVLCMLLLAVFAWNQIDGIGHTLRGIAVEDAVVALNSRAVEDIEHMTTDIAGDVARFLYERDDDIRYLASLAPTEENYRRFAERMRRVVDRGSWELSEDGKSWVPVSMDRTMPSAVSTNPENDDWGGFHFRAADQFRSIEIPLYDEVTFVGLDGRERIKIVTASTKTRYPMDSSLKDVSKRENTYVKAETYFEELPRLERGEIYVSEVIGAYVGTNYIGMYVPSKVEGAAMRYAPEEQAYAGREHPNGRRFEGIVRWAMPVYDAAGQKIGYATFALDHDHIMELVDHATPTDERYTAMPSANEGNYATIWDYKCRNICHPRHHSIFGYDPETGEPQVPWLESSIYDAWQRSGIEKWYDFIEREGVPDFDAQSRAKSLAPELAEAGLVGLDGRYLNNAPQCTGWMDLTADGGSGSFYVMWSGLYELSTAAAIPYYTGRYAPSEENGNTRRGFGIVTISAGLSDFTAPAIEMEQKISEEIDSHISSTTSHLILAAFALIAIIVVVICMITNRLAARITTLIDGVMRMRSGELHFRFDTPAKDEFGLLADAFDAMAESIRLNFKNPLTITDISHRIVHMNDRALELTGRKIEDVLSLPYEKVSVYPPGSSHDPIAAFREGREADIYHLEPHDLYLKPMASYMIGVNGNPIGYFIESIDVTEMHKMRIEVERAMHEAEAASSHKTHFLARMSHEIRTPMNAIIGMSSIIRRRIDALPERTPQINEIDLHVEKIDNASHHLLNLLNDVLDISKIESGTIELVMEEIKLGKIQESIDSIIMQRCEEKKLTYVRDIDQDVLDAVCVIDSLRARQLMSNLLDNAVKFTLEGGTITIIGRKLDERDGEMLLGVTVKDTGIGIEPERLEKIFEPFEQADRAITRTYGGAGLGLSISRQIARLFGGDIKVASEPGKGSEFSFEIWIKTVNEKKVKAYTAEDLEGKLDGKRLLLVDDIEINRTIVATLIEDTGITIDEASDGAEAVEMFKSSPVGTYDMVLMDIQMPIMDGYEATLTIRWLDRPDAATVPIVALSANSFQDDIQRSLDNKMNAHLAKPVDESALMGALAHFLLDDDIS